MEKLAALLKQFKGTILSYALKTWGGITGIKAKIVIYCGQVIADLLETFIKNVKRKHEQEKALGELKKVDENPASTVDEKGEAYEKMFNSGR